MTDPLILLAFIIIYLSTGAGLLALAGGIPRPRLQPIPIRKPGRIPRDQAGN